MTGKNFQTIIKIEHLFDCERGVYGVSTQEVELFKIINENDNPELAVLTAIKVFAAFLEQPVKVPEPLVVCPLESA